MELSELSYVLSTIYGWDITTKKSRKQKLVYAKKVFCKFASEMGYGPTEIGDALGIKHDLAIYHKDTFNVVMPIDLLAYNSCIDYFNAPLNKINGLNELRYGSMMSEVIDGVSKIGHKDLRYFIDTIIPNFKRKLIMEKKLMKMGKTNLR